MVLSYREIICVWQSTEILQALTLRRLRGNLVETAFLWNTEKKTKKSKRSWRINKLTLLLFQIAVIHQKTTYFPILK